MSALVLRLKTLVAMKAFCRHSLLALLALSVILAAGPAVAGVLIPAETARRNGMKRAWFSQVELNPARQRVVSMALGGRARVEPAAAEEADAATSDGMTQTDVDADTAALPTDAVGEPMLVALTSAGVVHAMAADTGQTLWTNRIGNPDYPSLGPAISDKYIALVNGSTLYVLDRATGGEVLQRRAGGGVGGGPSLSPTHVFVPLFSGRIEGFPLEQPKQSPWYYTSSGRIFHHTVAASGSVVWSTDRSKLYVADSAAEGVRYRFDTGSPIVAPATIRAPLVFAASQGGYVYALDENTGQQQWRYAAGFSVAHSPVVVGERLYVATDEPALHAINAETGLSDWVAPGVSQFVAASQKRVYGIGGPRGVGGLVALSADNGVVRARAASRGLNTAVLNDQTDRLYIYSDDGLVQCFHETGSDKPYYHQPQPDDVEGEAKPESDQPASESPAPAETPADPFATPPAADPFGGSDEPAPEEDEPSEPPTPAPNDPFGGEDPFGGLGEDPFG